MADEERRDIEGEGEEQEGEEEARGIPMTIQELFEMLHRENPVEARLLLQQLVLQR